MKFFLRFVVAVIQIINRSSPLKMPIKATYKYQVAIHGHYFGERGGNRTHHGNYKITVNGFEVREIHQNLSTPDIYFIIFLLILITYQEIT